jgi:hypothetical protein
MTKIRIVNASVRVLHDRRRTIVGLPIGEEKVSRAKSQTILHRSEDARDHAKDPNKKMPWADLLDASIGEVTPGAGIHQEAASSVKIFLYLQWLKRSLAFNNFALCKLVRTILKLFHISTMNTRKTIEKLILKLSCQSMSETAGLSKNTILSLFLRHAWNSVCLHKWKAPIYSPTCPRALTLKYLQT